MSTATQANQSDSSRYVEYDEFIDFQVQKTRAGIKSNDLLTALIGAAVVVLGYVLVFAIFDHWVIDGGFGRGTRLMLLLAMIAGLSGWFVWKLALPYFRRVTALYAAREIEETEPEFRSTLMTLIDLNEAGREIPPRIRAVLEKRAGLGLTHMDVEQAVDRRLLMRLSYLLLGLVVITCLYTVLSPKNLSNSLWRSLFPAANIAVDTRTRIDRVEPGDVEVLARMQLEVIAELSGQIPDEVSLLYSTADRRLVDEPITMRETDDGLHQYRGAITGENGRGILQDLTYRVVAGDAQSETYKVTVSQPPSATVNDVLYEYPRYMSFRDRSQIGGAIDAWEGTWVTIRATANMPVESALVLFSDTDDVTQKAEELLVTVENGTQLTARWQLRIRTDGTYPNFYRVQCRNDAGKVDPSPALHPVKIRADQPPHIQLAHPTTDLERPANAIVPLLFAAEDPDFLLRSVILNLEKNGEQLAQSPRLYEGPPYRKSVTGTHDLDLGPLDLSAGDKLTYWLEARDNMEPFADRSGNRSFTPKLNITVTDAVSAEDVQQQHEEDQRQIEERRDEAQRQADEVAREPQRSGDDPAAGSPPPDNATEEPDEQPGEPSPADEEQQNAQQTERDSAQDGQSSGSSNRQEERQHSRTGNGESQQQEPSESREGDRTGDQEAPFDDLLKRMMQRQREQSDQSGDQDRSDRPQPNDDPQHDNPDPPEDRPPSSEDSSSAGEPNQSPDRQQDSAEGQPPPGGNSDDASPSNDISQGDSEGDSQSASDGEHSSATSDTTEPTQSDNQTTTPPKPGQGTEPGTDAENPSVREGDADGGQPNSEHDEQTTDRQASSDASDTAEGSRQQPNGSEGGEPTPSNSNEQPNAENPRTAPEGPAGDPSDPGNASATETGEQPTGPNAQGEQPPGPNQPGTTPGDPGAPQSNRHDSQPSNQSQQPTQGSPSEGQQDTSNPSGQPGQSSQSDGQPSQGDQQSPQADNENTPGQSSDSSGGEASSASQQTESDEGQPSQGQQSPSGGGATPENGEETNRGDSPTEASPPEQSGDNLSSQEAQPNSGGEQSSGGQQDSGSQPSSGAQQTSEGSQSGQQQSGSSGGAQQPGGDSNNGQSPQPGGSGVGRDQNPVESSPSGDSRGGNESGDVGGEGEGGAAGDVSGDDPDLENKRKAANLLLKRLQEQLQRGEVDPDLKEELGVTDDQMRDFAERLRQRLTDTGDDHSPEAQARRRQFEETLKSFDYDSRGTERQGGAGSREAAEGFSGSQRTAPVNRRDATRRYREKLSRQRTTGGE